MTDSKTYILIALLFLIIAIRHFSALYTDAVLEKRLARIEHRLLILETKLDNNKILHINN